MEMKPSQSEVKNVYSPQINYGLISVILSYSSNYEFYDTQGS